MIPKIIHYCWLSDDPMSEDSLKYIETWRNVLPDYDFVLWNQKKFDMNSVPWVKEAFDCKKYAFAADFIRLYAVYNYGGIYLDSDVEVVKKFDDLLEQPLMLGYESEKKSGIEAGCFGAEKKNSFIGSCLTRYENRHFIRKDGSMDTETLPMIMQERVSEDEEKFIYPCDYFTAKSQNTGEVERTLRTYTIHHFAGSWMTQFERSILRQTESIFIKYGNGCKGKIFLMLNIARMRYKCFGVWRTTFYYLKKYFLFSDGLGPLRKLISYFK